MNLDDLATFVHVVRDGGVAAAARALGAPKSTVSRSVARLERELGVQLLERSTKQALPTREGAELYDRCARVVGEAEAAARDVGRAATEPCGVLRLTAGRSLEPLLAPILARYAERFPDVGVEAHLVDRHVDLVDEGFDLAIRGSHALDDSALVARRFGTVGHVLVASPAYLAKRPAPRAPEALAAHRCITTGEVAGEHVWVLGDPGQIVRVTGHIHATTSSLARELALAGHGIAMQPTWTCADDVAAGRLRVVLKSHGPAPMPQWLVYPNGHPPARVRAFVDLLVEGLRTCPGWTLSRDLSGRAARRG